MKDLIEMLERAHKLDENVSLPVHESDNNTRSPFDFDGNVYVYDGPSWTDDTQFEVVGKGDKIIIQSYNSGTGDTDKRVVSTYEEAAEFVNDVLTAYGEAADTWQELGWYLDEALNRAHELDEAAFSGGMAGDNSFSGGTVRGRGASTQPSKKNYLGRLQSKNPDLVEIITVKGKDVKPGMLTQAGQVKTAEVKKNNRGETKVYIMHTNNYDGFWDADEDMEVLADPDDKSKPFTGDYRALLKRGLQESASNTALNKLRAAVDKLAQETGLELYISGAEEDGESVDLFCTEMFDVAGTGLINVIDYEDGKYDLEEEELIAHLKDYGLLDRFYGQTDNKETGTVKVRASDIKDYLEYNYVDEESGIDSMIQEVALELYEVDAEELTKRQRATIRKTLVDWYELEESLNEAMSKEKPIRSTGYAYTIKDIKSNINKILKETNKHEQRRHLKDLTSGCRLTIKDVDDLVSRLNTYSDALHAFVDSKRTDADAQKLLDAIKDLAI